MADGELLARCPGNKLVQSRSIVAASGMGSRSMAWTRSEAAGRSSGRFSGSTARCNAAVVQVSFCHQLPNLAQFLMPWFNRILIMAETCCEHIRHRHFYPIGVGLSKSEMKALPGKIEVIVLTNLEDVQQVFLRATAGA